MKKLIRRLCLIVALSALLVVPSFAETIQGDSGWQVTFTGDKKMESNFKSSDMDEVIMGMQPGDRVIFTLALTNANDTATDWYMTNKVLSSLEDSVGVAKGGAYTYILKYTNPAGTVKTLFDSDTVGGDDISAAGEGLHEATSALKDYFYLDTLTKGQSGSITLEVALDGETQANSYQNTLADLQMNFAVELNNNPSSPSSPSTPGSRKPTAVVNTGEDRENIPYLIAAAVSGCILLGLGIYGRRQRKQQREEGQNAEN